ncbi:MAG: hypothetical protein KME06_18045 [Kastovskya adunca ATA6-11-RM4]|nr:hypothetical protein [Kastovskya adunca ATA6-11-RM4]
MTHTLSGEVTMIFGGGHLTKRDRIKAIITTIRIFLVNVKRLPNPPRDPSTVLAQRH